ncbi:MAG: thioredoxin family protein [Thermoplasmata archaeon]|nr:thioredoxin family protein [Thermoplasmata archaeon]
MITISEEEKNALKADLETLQRDVQILYFEREDECPYCDDTLEILNLITSLSDKVKMNKVRDSEDPLVTKYNVRLFPAILLFEEDMTDTGIRFYGIPAGYEFESLLDAIMMVSTGKTEIPRGLEERIKGLKKEYRLSVFVTPTCPYCPLSVKIAHKIAYVNRKITGEMVEAIEFPELSQEFEVMGVPKTVIFHENDYQAFVGAYPLEDVVSFLETIEKESG